MREKKVLVGDIETNYKVFGRGRPFLVLHGWGSSSDKWQRVGELLSENNLKIIVVDLPGFGKSQEPKESWDLNKYVEWLLEFSRIVPELNSRFYLLGHSFGGTVTVKFSIKYPQKIEKLFLCSAAAIRKKTIKKQVLGQVSKVLKVFAFLPFYGLAKKAFYRFVVGSDDYLKSRGVMKESYLKVISEDLSYHLAFIKVPTVIVWGDKDGATLIDDAYFMNKKVENSKLIVIPNAKHSLQIEAPETLVQKILENL